MFTKKQKSVDEGDSEIPLPENPPEVETPEVEEDYPVRKMPTPTQTKPGTLGQRREETTQETPKPRQEVKPQKDPTPQGYGSEGGVGLDKKIAHEYDTRFQKEIITLFKRTKDPEEKKKLADLFKNGIRYSKSGEPRGFSDYVMGAVWKNSDALEKQGVAPLDAFQWIMSKLLDRETLKKEPRKNIFDQYDPNFQDPGVLEHGFQGLVKEAMRNLIRALRRGEGPSHVRGGAQLGGQLPVGEEGGEVDIAAPEEGGEQERIAQRAAKKQWWLRGLKNDPKTAKKFNGLVEVIKELGEERGLIREDGLNIPWRIFAEMSTGEANVKQQIQEYGSANVRKSRVLIASLFKQAFGADINRQYGLLGGTGEEQEIPSLVDVMEMFRKKRGQDYGISRRQFQYSLTGSFRKPEVLDRILSNAVKLNYFELRKERGGEYYFPGSKYHEFLRKME